MPAKPKPKTKQPAKPAPRPRLFRGHEKSGAWKVLFETMFGARGKVRVPRPESVHSVSRLLEAEHHQALPSLPPPVTENLHRDERRPATPPGRSHPVHDPKWYTPNQRRLWIPWAEDAPSGARRGTYDGKYPAGLVVHWTAGHRNGLKAGNDFMRSSGMLYLMVDKDGKLSQSDPLSHWGYHAGASSWPSASGTVSDEFVGVELQAWGHVTKSGDTFRSWAGHVVPPAEVRHCERRGNIRAGWYHIFTRQQMDTLHRLCVWLELNNPSMFRIENIVGHDEVSPGRKVDPGGALWDHDSGRALSMQEFRDLVRGDVATVKKMIAQQK